MLGHVPLGLRLVFERGPAGDLARRPPAPVLLDDCVASGADADPAPEWRLVGILPADPGPDGAAGGAQATGKGLPASHRPTRALVAARLTLDRDEAEGYYLNLTSPQPSLFVLLRGQEVGAAAARSPTGFPAAEAVTASYSEAARWMDGGMVVVRTAMPEPMLAWIAEFAQYHFQVEGKKKRGGFRPSFLTREEFGKVARSARLEAGQGASQDVEHTAGHAPDPRSHGGAQASGR